MAARELDIAIDVSSTLQRNPVSLGRARKAAEVTLRAERVRSAMLSVAFVSRAAIAKMNREYLGRSGATDVIAFGFARENADAPVIGDIYICPEVARKNARAESVSVAQEVLRLVVHGTLHVVGHDHEEDESRVRSDMWRRQERILKRVV